ncbi:MAG: sulfotransferase, partial [Verrucomicrobiae bacterium]|nr:sulfotransferase [Verrucomicrobiae bacterium]
RFSQFLMKSGRARFCEKTPSNCLRLRFIEALYPDARLIHLVRDGRSVVASMMRMLSKAPDADRVKARLAETPWRDLPALAPVFLRDTVERRLAGRKPFWGPRPPGWREWLDLPVPLMLARQWRTLVETALRDLTAFPSEHQCQIRYEDFVAAPREGLTGLLDLAGLRGDPDFLETTAAEVRPSSFADEWRQTLSDEAIAQIETEAGPLLEQLGYSLTSTPARPS